MTREKVHFFFLSPSRLYQFNCRIVRIPFVRQTIRIIEKLFRKREVTFLHDVLTFVDVTLKLPKDIANQRYDCALHWRRTCIGLEACTCRKNRRVIQLSFLCHSRRYFGDLQFVGTSRSDQPLQLCRTVRAAHSQPVHFLWKDSVRPGTSLSLAALMRSTTELADPAGQY